MGGSEKLSSEIFTVSIRADSWEGDADSNFSVFWVQRFTESPGPLHWIAFPAEILTKPLIHWIASPLFTENPFFSLKRASSHPLPKKSAWIPHRKDIRPFSKHSHFSRSCPGAENEFRKNEFQTKMSSKNGFRKNGFWKKWIPPKKWILKNGFRKNGYREWIPKIWIPKTPIPKKMEKSGFRSQGCRRNEFRGKTDITQTIHVP